LISLVVFTLACLISDRRTLDLVNAIAVVPEPGEPGGHQYFADQLTLFEPGRADYPHLLLLAPQCFSPSGITEGITSNKLDHQELIIKIHS
jgi:hypothetical protein